MFGRGNRRYLIVTGEGNEDGFRRTAMRQKMMNGGQFRMGGGNYKTHPAYEEGYKRGYEHAWKDHERMTNGNMPDFMDED